MEIILSRHGNTFGPDDTPVWVGAKEDLALVEKGRQQAAVCAELFRRSSIMPNQILCGPLLRTREYARIVSESIGYKFEPKIDSRLNELDYGEWEGLSSQQIRAVFGEQELERWETRSIWPVTARWQSNQAEVEAEVHSLIRELVEVYDQHDLVLLVSSNGRMRYFLSYVAGLFEKYIESGSFKIKTGNICKLDVGANHFEVVYWNQDPSKLERI